MIKKIAVVGHKRTVKIVRKVIATYYKNIQMAEVDFIETMDVERVCETLKNLENEVDGVLFTGRIPYDLLNATMVSHTPWVYIDQNYSQLQRTLLEGVYHYGYDIKNASIDSYTEEVVYNAYKEIQLPKTSLQVQISTHDIFEPSFLEKLLNFHRENIEMKRASFCLTGVSSIYETLEKEGLPCLWLRPTVDTIKNTIERLKLRQRHRISAEREIVVLSVEPDLRDEYELASENEYQLRLQKNKLAEAITLFAQKIQAAIVETGSRGYLLFSTKNIVEMETNEFKTISLLDDVKRKTGTTVSLGIGFGTTAREAKFHALKGMYRARKYGGHQAYVVTEKRYIGPIKPLNIDVESELAIEASLMVIADRTGISLNTIFKLHCIVAENTRNRFTPKELSDLLGNSVRSTNRLLEKLESAQLIEITGRQIVGSAGRPSRVFKILF